MEIATDQLQFENAPPDDRDDSGLYTICYTESISQFDLKCATIVKLQKYELIIKSFDELTIVCSAWRLKTVLIFDSRTKLR